MNGQKGITLIELTIVIVLLALISGLLFPLVANWGQDDLLASARPGPVFLDLPETNGDAVTMAREAGMTPAFETARMYAGEAPILPLHDIYGITSFELG